ncbi:MAG TPA: hypothetical protein VLY83_06600 [Methanoregula sp.]|nr:hypothetical protein [Methanoregula sp.]
MKRLITAGLLILCLLVGIVSATAGEFGFTVNPEGNFVQGSLVNISFAINFSERFTYTHDLQFSTQLEDPVWNYTIFLNSVPEPRPDEKKNAFSLSGFELDYPTRKVQVTGTLEGTAPAVSGITKTTVLSVNEFDTRNNVTVASPYLVERYDLPDPSLLPGPAIPPAGAPPARVSILDRIIVMVKSIFGLGA